MYGSKAIGEIVLQGWTLTEHIEEENLHRAVFTSNAARKPAAAALVIAWARRDGRFSTPVITLSTPEGTITLPVKTERVLRTTPAADALKALTAPPQANAKAVDEGVPERHEEALTAA